MSPAFFSTIHSRREILPKWLFFYSPYWVTEAAPFGVRHAWFGVIGWGSDLYIQFATAITILVHVCSRVQWVSQCFDYCSTLNWNLRRFQIERGKVMGKFCIQRAAKEVTFSDQSEFANLKQFYYFPKKTASFWQASVKTDPTTVVAKNGFL